jgi:DNA-binding transcriptional ArsR family regulator
VAGAASVPRAPRATVICVPDRDANSRTIRRVASAREALLDPRSASFLEEVQTVVCEMTRSQIVLALSSTSLNVTELASTVGCSKWTASRHLRVLRESGIVEPQRHGRQIVYRLDEGPAVEAALAALRTIESAAHQPELGRAPNGSV